MEIRNTYISYMRTKNLSERTIKEYLYYFDKFDMKAVDQMYISSFIEKHNNNVARAFLHSLLLFVKIFADLGYKDSFNDLIIPKVTGRPKSKMIKTITLEEVHKISSHMHKRRDKIMVLLTFYGGLRAKSLLTIKPKESFNWDTWIKDTSEYGELVVLGKGNKEYKVAVIPELMQSIYDWINDEVAANQSEDDPLFNIKYSRWQTILAHHSKKALGYSIHPHALRHSLATHLTNNGVDLRIIQEILGHSSITSTTRYAHLNKEKVIDTLKGVL